MDKIIPESERPTRSELMPAAVAVVSAMICALASLVVGWMWLMGARGP